MRPTKACFGWITSNRWIFHHLSSFMMTLGPSSSAFISFLSYRWLFNVATLYVNGPWGLARWMKYAIFNEALKHNISRSLIMSPKSRATSRQRYVFKDSNFQLAFRYWQAVLITYSTHFFYFFCLLSLLTQLLQFKWVEADKIANQLEKLEAARTAYLWLHLVTYPYL